MLWCRGGKKQQPPSSQSSSCQVRAKGLQRQKFRPEVGAKTPTPLQTFALGSTRLTGLTAQASTSHATEAKSADLSLGIRAGSGALCKIPWTKNIAVLKGSALSREVPQNETQKSTKIRRARSFSRQRNRCSRPQESL